MPINAQRFANKHKEEKKIEKKARDEMLKGFLKSHITFEIIDVLFISKRISFVCIQYPWMKKNTWKDFKVLKLDSMCRWLIMCVCVCARSFDYTCNSFVLTKYFKKREKLLKSHVFWQRLFYSLFVANLTSRLYAIILISFSLVHFVASMLGCFIENFNINSWCVWSNVSNKGSDIQNEKTRKVTTERRKLFKKKNEKNGQQQE